MLGGLTETQIAIALAAALGAAFVRGLAGFGMAILLVPVLGLALPPREAVVVANWLGLLIGLVGLRRIIGTSERSALVMSLVAVVSTPVGVWLLARTDPAIARMLIALIALGAFVLVLLPKKPAHYAPTLAVTGASGFVSGVLTGFAGMPGPPVVPYYLRREISAEVARASMMVVFIATSLAGVLSALMLRVATVREPILALMLFPAVLLGNWLGYRAFGKVSDPVWRAFTGGVLGLAAAAALWRLHQA